MIKLGEHRVDFLLWLAMILIAGLGGYLLATCKPDQSRMQATIVKELERMAKVGPRFTACDMADLMPLLRAQMEIPPQPFEARCQPQREDDHR